MLHTLIVSLSVSRSVCAPAWHLGTIFSCIGSMDFFIHVILFLPMDMDEDVVDVEVCEISAEVEVTEMPGLVVHTL